MQLPPSSIDDAVHTSSSSSYTTTNVVDVSISDAFDGGNGSFVRQTTELIHGNANQTVVHVRMKPDPFTELEDLNHMQYFAFRATVRFNAAAAGGGGAGAGGEAGEEGAAGDAPAKKKHVVTYVLENAADASYPEAWPGSTVCSTTTLSNPDSWRRCQDTTYVDGTLRWSYEHSVVTTCSGGSSAASSSSQSVYFAYFPPYGYDRHLDLIAKCEQCPYAAVNSLGQSLDGREIECITVGTGQLTAWIIHRQHPGETMAEWYAEGLLTRLLGLDEGHYDGSPPTEVKKALEKFTFHIVPNMCPDGSVRGHLRTNAAGANLNREWTTIKNTYVAPTPHRSPEVHAVLAQMDVTGCDVFLDVHGDEELPYNFLSGAECVPTWGPRLQSLHGAFLAEYERTNSDMQRHIGYPPPDDREQAKQYLNVATNQIATRFDCLAVTLEMPFKDCESHSDEERGWSPARSMKLGASVIKPLLYVHPHLRPAGYSKHEEDDEGSRRLRGADAPIPYDFPPEDAYVTPTDDWQGAFKPLKRRMYSDVHAGHPHVHDGAGIGGFNKGMSVDPPGKVMPLVSSRRPSDK